MSEERMIKATDEELLSALGKSKNILTQAESRMRDAESRMRVSGRNYDALTEVYYERFDDYETAHDTHSAIYRELEARGYIGVPGGGESS